MQAWRITSGGYAKSEPIGEDLGEATALPNRIPACCPSAIAPKRATASGELISGISYLPIYVPPMSYQCDLDCFIFL